MAKRMLIDATHAEETRVVVVNGNKLDELDFEIASKKQLKGNIYLAKVTRVEPSLQAAFVEYGGNRHGFLAFSEIHPDYYQIPVADREALMREEEEAEREEHAADDASDAVEAETGSVEEVVETADSAAADATTAPSVSQPADEGAEIDESEQTEDASTEASAEADPQSTASDDESDGGTEAGHIEEAPTTNEPVESVGGGGGTTDILE